MITAQELYYKSIEQQLTHRKGWNEISEERQMKYDVFAFWANELFKEKQNQTEMIKMQTESEKRRELAKQKFDEGYAYCEQKHRLIPVSERLPKESGSYIVQTSNVGFVIAWFEQGQFALEHPTTEAVAWQYLPKEIESA